MAGATQKEVDEALEKLEEGEKESADEIIIADE